MSKRMAPPEDAEEPPPRRRWAILQQSDHELAKLVEADEGMENYFEYREANHKEWVAAVQANQTELGRHDWAQLQYEAKKLLAASEIRLSYAKALLAGETDSEDFDLWVQDHRPRRIVEPKLRLTNS